MKNPKICLVLFLFCLFSSFSSFSQFTDIIQTPVLNGTSYGNIIWGDFDNDNDLDAFIVGNSTSRLYRNDGSNTFVYISTGISGIQYGSYACGDYDNDGDLDIAITGNAGTSKISKIYRNQGGLVFTDISAGLVGVDWSTIEWGDYDNDGRLDLIVSGLSAINEPVAKLYHNNGNDSFTDSGITITPCTTGMIKWGDYNNDNLLDILMMGQDFDGNANTEIYRNDGNNHFIPINANLKDGFRGGVDWGDYDNDGDLDIVQGGQLCGTQIYRNDGNNTFTNINAGLPALSYCPAAWGDYDKDGDLDVIIAGRVGTADNTRLFQQNTVNNTFIEVSNTIITCRYGSLAWGDSDNDGDIDLLITGALPPVAKFYRNDNPGSNTAPTVPSGIQSTVINNGALLTWNLSSDTQTPSAGLTYNVRIGTTTNGFDILSPMSNISTGYKRNAALGNAMQGNSYYIKNLPAGIYYWSVQAVDPNFIASAFSSTGSFTILPTVTDMNLNMIALNTGSSAWGDFDKDGDLDFLLMGYDVGISKFASKIYRNDGNSVFDTINASLKGVNYGTGAWGDYDNDGDLDILIAGATGISPNLNPVSKVYRNNGNSTFTDINAGLTGVSNCSGAWGDYDNDGDLDILLAGIEKSTIYRNDGSGVFTDINANFVTINLGSASFGDYDRDNDLDVLIFGTAGTKIYSNNGNGTFSNPVVNLPGGSEGSAAWGDYDNDGFLDIFLTGNVSGGNSARIYRNNGSGSYSDIGAGLRGVSESHGIWGDFNNDGYSDILYTGRSGSFITKVYINNKDGTFTDIYAPLAADYRSKLSTADYDNDGDLDMFVTRYELKPLLYRNNMNFPNNPPSAPAGLNAENTSQGVIVSWDPSTDNQSTNGGLYYNIRLGKTSQGKEIFSPMVSVPGNKRLIPSIGNAQLNTSWLVKSLPVGTYYWSVQAIDHGLLGGDWAAEKSFVVKNVQAYFSSDEVCKGLPTHFTDQSIATKGITSWLWDFGDGNTSSFQNPQHTYAASGTYNVKLTITDSEASTDFIIHSLVVRPKPSTNFTASIVCQGTSTSFTNTTNNNGLNILSWSWDFGDGQSSIIQNPTSHGYLGAADYNVKLSALADNGCMDEIIKTVTVVGYPAAAVSADGATTFCTGQSVTLSTQLNPDYTYLWKRDGALITGANSNIYLAQIAGSYAASVTNKGLCTTLSSAVPVVVNTAPGAPLISSAGPLTFCQGQSVDLSVAFNSGYTYQWKLNGGAVGTNSNLYAANSSGTYTLIVANAFNCFANSTNSVEITVNPLPTVPTVNISGPTTFCQGGSVELSVSATSGYTYQWENNGSAITGANANTYIANASGVYSLKITNSSGCFSKTENVAVNVLNAPASPTISASGPVTFCQGDAVALNVAYNSDYTYQWKLNGGAVGTNSNNYSANASGTYTLVVTNSANCSVNSLNGIAVTVNPKPSLPTVSISGPTAFCQGGNVELSVTTTPGYEYQWENNGAGITGAIFNSFLAQNSGTYALKVSNSYGCSSKTENVAVNVLTVPSAPAISASGPTTFCSGDSVILSVASTSGYSYQWKLNGGAVGTNSNLLTANSSGSYTLVVTNSSGCSVSSVNPVAVTVNPLPVLSDISLIGGDKFCSGKSASLSVPSNTNYSYSWKKGTSLLGISSNSITATETGEYSIEITLATCKAITKPVKIVVVEKPAKPTIDTSLYIKGMCLGESPLKLSVDNAVAGYSYKWYKNETPISSSTSIEILEAGNYYLESSMDICTSDQASVNIVFMQTLPKPDIIAKGPTLWYLSTTSKASYYRWYHNGNHIPGADNSVYVAAQNPGIYRVGISNDNQCFAFSDSLRIPIGVTGIEDTDPFKGVKIYPNPTTGWFTIEMDNNIFGELIIDIFTQNGSKALNIKFEKTTEHFSSQIDLSGQSKGMYMINLAIDKFNAARKILVE